MDEQAFRRERMLASGLLREPSAALDHAVLAHLTQAAQRPMRDGGEAACSSGVLRAPAQPARPQQ